MTQPMMEDGGATHDGDDGGVGIADFPEPNPQEAMFFFNMIRNMVNQPDIDWDGVANDSGFKNAAVAKIKQKLGLDSRAGSSVTTKSPRKPRATKAAAAAAAANEAPEGNGADKPASPAKVTKRRKAAGAGKSTSEKAPRGRQNGNGPNGVSSGPDASYRNGDGPVGCLTVGFLKNEDDEDDDEDSGI